MSTFDSILDVPLTPFQLATHVGDAGEGSESKDFRQRVMESRNRQRQSKGVKPMANLAVNAIRSVGSRTVSAYNNAPAGVKDKIRDLLNRATGGRVQTDAAVAELAQSKNGVALVALNAARAGINPDLMFTRELIMDGRNTELQSLYGKVSAVFNEVYGKLDAAAPIHGNSGAERTMLNINVVKALMNTMGIRSEQSLRELHVNLKMFVAMDESAVSESLAFMKVAR